MAIDLLAIQPYKVSRDLSGYITLIYGPQKIGKTTFGSQMPGYLLLAFERGYNGLQGAMKYDITSWGVFKQVVRELKKPEVKDKFKSLIIDTVDFAADFCQKYICNQLGVENIGDGGWTNNGWAKYKKEFEDTFRELSQLGYAIVFISHDKEKTIKPQNGTEYQQITSTLQSSALAIVENMCDIIAYAHEVVDSNGNSRRILSLRSSNGTIRCGCRFKYMAPEVEFSYSALTKALNDAIDKEAAENANQYVTNERAAAVTQVEYDFDALMTEFQDMVGALMNKDQTYYAPRITQVIDKYLGKGKKILDATRDQAEMINLIVLEIREDLFKGANN